MSHIRGRFHKDADESVVKYTASIPFDWRLYRHDIAGSIAHVRMLARQGIILEKDAEVIAQGLIAIGEEIEQGKFQFKPELEDVHMNIESRLVEMIGEVGGKLHTARSRNDQVALDLRLFAKEAISNTLVRLREFQQALISLAEVNKSVIMPGYTHLQPAQPVLLAHHLLAYFEMLQRDIGRFSDCLRRVDVMPLGSGALAGVTYDIDRDFLARELGFGQISNNSMDAVSDRDFVVEYEATASLCMMHLSRLAEEIILWSSAEFDFVELDGMQGSTGAGSSEVIDHVGIPTLSAIIEALEALDEINARDKVQLVLMGGLRDGTDAVKALCLGADAAAFGTPIIIAGGCIACMQCHVGQCVTGIATQDPEHEERYKPETEARNIHRFLESVRWQIAAITYALGYADVRELNRDDLVALTPEAATITGLPYEPNQSRQHTSAMPRRMSS